ncbi:IgGFc-binding protein-like [Coregonus clupeaformis]|uniref:IgGFc-binding protein-like n=1 Tax=Coregonus clupeaformis TaxID=59861 RepID=UPI001E1C58CD|nr:IgGFc-binding protein-like [Coregonus clupeaformis]
MSYFIYQVKCVKFSCGPHEKCEVKNGVRDCQGVGKGVCTISGDPHYKTFDNSTYDFQGTCTYTAAQGCHLEGTRLNPFSVVVENEKWYAMSNNPKVAVAKLVAVEVYGNTLVLRKNQAGMIMVNGIMMSLPVNLNNGAVQAYQEGTYDVIITDFGLRVTYDLVYHVMVTVPGNYRGKTCGLCGNFNDNKNDEFQLPDGKITKDLLTFGAAWKISVPHVVCEDGCSGEFCPKCDANKKAIFEADCSIITNPKGPFAACHNVIDPASYFRDCVYDVCLSEGDRKVLCHSISAYMIDCQDFGVNISNWRTPTFCPLDCPANSHYQSCSEICATPCPGLSDIITCPTTCAEGCACNTDYYFNGTGCVKWDLCSCYHKGRTYKIGESVLSEDCQELCTCTASGDVKCEATKCKADESCQVMNGHLGCVRKGVCTISGDPHYKTFDNSTYDFQGTCTYTAAQGCHLEGTRLNPFSVVVENEKWYAMSNNPKVAVAKLVAVEVYGNTLVLRKNQAGMIMVNGIMMSLPVNLNNGAVQAYQEGTYDVIITDFGLRVTYDLVYHVMVTVPGNYRGKTCGLCGNFNDNKNDEFQLPDGKITKDLLTFGAAWKISVPHVVCEDGCSGEFCPKCDANKKAIFEADCSIITNPKGPFAACHNVIDPASYFRDCVYDVCLSEGDRKVLCHSISAYMIDCQDFGVNISNWRTPTFCPLDCPANSHYQSCSEICATPCPGLSDIITCPTTCAEGCACNTDYYFNGTGCVKWDLCSCYHKGRTYKIGESVLSEDCQELCTCTASGDVKCEATKCKADESCQVMNGHLGCVRKGVCTISGDPHYKTFDNSTYDFQGTCTYTAAQGCHLEGTRLNPFSVVVENEKWYAMSNNPKVAVAKLVAVEVYGNTLVLRKNQAGMIMVNGIMMSLPVNLNNGAVQAYQEGTYDVIITDFGLRVTYDLVYHVMVTVPGNYRGKTCGLCGNFNDNKNDEFQLPDGKITKDLLTFGAAWKISVPHVVCEDGCSGEFCPKCDANKKAIFEADCSIITNPKGPFAACHNVIDPASYFRDCVYDVCLSEGDRKVLCHSISAYMIDCQDFGVNISNWRTPTFCPLDCPANSHYQSCSEICATPCPGLSDIITCPTTCAEGCACNTDYYFNGTGCVKWDLCSCYHKGRTYKIGESVLSEDCQELCTCTASGDVKCEATKCKADESCQVMNGHLGCVRKGVCTISGDPHYKTFDNSTYDFQGTCTYTAAQGCHLEGTRLNPFSVVVENEKWYAMSNNPKVAVAKLVAVEVYGNTLVLRKNQAGMIMVNGIMMSLPVNLNNGAVQAYQEGTYDVIITDFGLRVTYDLVYHVMVTVPGNYRGKTCGLCGNFNDNKNDEFQLPDGKITKDLLTFGAAWKISVPHVVCEDGCSGEFCPKCDANKKAIFEADCSIITNPKGPFAACHNVIDPASYFSDCVYDVCLSEGDRKVLCHSISAYMIDCQDFGVNISNWRTPTFCPLDCPANSHYQSCSEICATPCPGLSDIITCPTTCAEGCACNTDYYFNGTGCVKWDLCSCYHKGRTYKIGESVLSEDCQELCTCTASGDVKCEATKCKADESCQVMNGHLGCVRKGVCTISGDPHYKTFDNSTYDFQGTCTYTAAQGCHLEGTRLNPFSVVVENEKWYAMSNNPKVAVAKLVAVEVYGNTLVLRKNQAGMIMVNGIMMSLPVNLNNGAVQAYQEGTYDVIITDFGLRVTYDLVYHVMVTVPGNYRGKTCGLCGNFNDNKNDEFQLPDGKITKDLLTFGAAWKISVPHVVCEDGCS